MGSQDDPFISLVEAGKILGRTPEEVIALCDEGLIRRRFTGSEITIHKQDTLEVEEANLQERANPRSLVKDVLLLKRQVSALQETIDLMGKVNGMLSSSLSEVPTEQLFEIFESTERAILREEWSDDELLMFCEIFLRISETDVLRLNEYLCVQDTWKVFYTLCLDMCRSVRTEENLNNDREMARILLMRGLRNLRSIGVVFVENAEFLKTSREILERTLSHDFIEFDSLIKKFKQENKIGRGKTSAKNSGI